MKRRILSVSDGMFGKNRCFSGFTLVEMMFAVTIGIMVLGFLTVFYVQGSHLTMIDLAVAEVNSSARLAMDKIVRDVRWSDQITTSHTFSGTNYVTANDELVFEIPSIDADGDMIASTYDYVIYALDSSDATLLRRIVDADASSSRTDRNNIVARDVSAFSLTSGGTGLSSVGSLSTVSTLEISITITKRPLPGRTVTKTLRSDVKLRNQ